MTKMEQKKEQTIYKRRLSSTIPYGWKLVEGSTDLLEEVPLELAYLEKAKEYLKGSSYREVAKWLSAKTGRKISHVALYKMSKKELSDKRSKAARIRWRQAKAKAAEETQEDLSAEAEAYKRKESNASS